MNNFETYDRIKSIDETIKFWIGSNNIKWENEFIYSWGWTQPDEKLTMRDIYKNSNLEFTLVKSDDLTDITKQMSENIDVRFYDVTDTSFLKRKLEDKFTMELTLNLFNGCGILPYNLVITNVTPDKKLFGEDQLYSEIGKWYTGF